ncbi:MAG: hypothetical protein ABIY55_24280 [Kofleriaceae bacterium]
MTTPIELRAQTVWLDAEGIVRVELKPGADVTLADAHAVVTAIGLQCARGRRPALIDFTGLRGMERAARNYFAGPQTAKYQTVAALVVTSPLARAVGNFFMGLNRPMIPTRMFPDTASALVWLRTQVAA